MPESPADTEKRRRDRIAGVLRDIIHETPMSQCGVGSDTCPDWPLAYEWADKVMAALVAHSFASESERADRRAADVLRLEADRDRLEKELRERKLDDAALQRAIREQPGWEDFNGTPSSAVGAAADYFIRAASLDRLTSDEVVELGARAFAPPHFWNLMKPETQADYRTKAHAVLSAAKDKLKEDA
jgi:hypothetical protein